MRLPLSCLALAGLLAGCGPSPATFDAEYAEAYCSLEFACYDAAALATFGWTDEADCVSQMSAEDTAAPGDYDRRAARDCLDQLATLTCDDLTANAFPLACAAAR